MRVVITTWTGGVVALLLNHRLMSGNPPGSGRGDAGMPHEGGPAQGETRFRVRGWGLPGTPDGVQDISRATLPDRRNGTGPIPEGSQASKLDVWGMRFSAETDPPERGGAGGSNVW